VIENFSKTVKSSSPEADMLGRIDFSRLPQHVAVIMDGNGRWAKARGKARIFGHREGAESVRSLLDSSARLGLKALTLYAFSTENWKRPADEVGALMQMLKRYLKSELKSVHKNNIRFRAIGMLEGLSPDIQKELNDAMLRTSENTGTILSVALNYGSRAEIVEACKKAVRELDESGKTIDQLSAGDIDRHLYTRGLPEVDLLIRTSGEMRISNFLLWQLAYSEIYVTQTLFPDFRLKEFLEAIIDFQQRERRFGDISGSS
jgi:undecaprenyl diphosphate synthase